MNRTNKTCYAILGMLSFAPMSGYEIKQTMQQSTHYFWSESDGQLYPMLTKLAKLGWVSCKARKKISSREKKVYSLTTTGRNELKKWLREEAETQTTRNEFMLKLFFGANITPGLSLEHIQTHRQQIKKMKAQMVKIKKQLTVEYQNSRHFVYWQMTLQYGLKIANAKLSWCNEVSHALNELKLKKGKR